MKARRQTITAPWLLSVSGEFYAIYHIHVVFVFIRALKVDVEEFSTIFVLSCSVDP